MRHWSGIGLALALAAIAPQTVMTILTGAVSVLLEALPYLAGAALLAPLAGRYARAIVAYAGCGCGAGSNARSIPAALATAALFGPFVAATRVALASITARMLPTHDHAETSVLSELADLVPAALLAATIALLVPTLPLRGVHPVLLWFAGALLGIFASPCALGGVALAAALRASAPFAAAGVLCTAGMLPQLRLRQTHDVAHDPLAYLLLALVGALTATRHGGTLVHPRLTIPLALCAAYCLVLAWRYRASVARTPRAIAAGALAIVVIGAPQPTYHATETTLADAFAGERVDFTGVVVTGREGSALVRYAITCCRADAAPVALVVDRNLAPFEGRWLHVRGTMQDDGGALRLHVAGLTPIAPPNDPFVYR
ncbi:MAG TPA: hypothetical protein VF741_07355 [Candidatus Aquilonibacter sp.]